MSNEKFIEAVFDGAPKEIVEQAVKTNDAYKKVSKAGEEVGAATVRFQYAQKVFEAENLLYTDMLKNHFDKLAEEMKLRRQDVGNTSDS